MSPALRTIYPGGEPGWRWRCNWGVIGVSPFCAMALAAIGPMACRGRHGGGLNSICWPGWKNTACSMMLPARGTRWEIYFFRSGSRDPPIERPWLMRGREASAFGSATPRDWVFPLVLMASLGFMKTSHRLTSRIRLSRMRNCPGSELRPAP